MLSFATDGVLVLMKNRMKNPWELVINPMWGVNHELHRYRRYSFLTIIEKGRGEENFSSS
jgi:hypothetical protein